MTLMNTLDSFDLFQVDLPSFKVQGRNAISSLPGGIMSLIICFLMLFYASIKLVHLLSRYNPQVS